MKAFFNPLLFFFACLNQLPAQALAADNELALDLSRAIHVGEGCSADASERQLLAYYGGLLRVQTTGMGLLLGLGGSSELAARANCTVRIPYEVPEGKYLKAISSRLAYGVYKTEGARGSIAARVGTADMQAKTQIDFAEGHAEDEYFLVKAFEGGSTGSSVEDACRHRKGILRFDLATSGQLQSIDDKLILETILGEIKVYTRFELGSCSDTIITDL